MSFLATLAASAVAEPAMTNLEEVMNKSADLSAHDGASVMAAPWARILLFTSEAVVVDRSLGGQDVVAGNPRRHQWTTGGGLEETLS